MTTLPPITDAQRRARLVDRHHLGRTADGPEAAVRGVVALHSSDPATPYLATKARVPGFQAAHLEQALHEDRTLWRLHAMRRTLFVVPAEEAAVFSAGAGLEVAVTERRKLERWLEAEMDPGRVPEWIAEVEAGVLEALREVGELRTGDLAREVPELSTPITVGSGKWGGQTPVSSRLLFLMALEGHLVRTRPAGTWRSSQYHWAAAAPWFGETATALDPAHARVELARRYLARFGPATLTDLRWWTGWTAKHARAALRESGAVRVTLDGGGEGFVLPHDIEGSPSDAAVDEAPGEHGLRAALLPALDSTPMGWKERRWYLGELEASLFDRNGNVGPTVWVDGRIVGGWGQRPGGEVVWRLLEDAGTEATAAVEAEAAALTGWLDGAVVKPRFRTPLERELSG